MKRYLFPMLFMLAIPITMNGQNASELVKRADEKQRGEKSSYSEMTMKIIRSSWNRTLSFKSWNKGTEYSLVYITAPAREKGQSFLKIKREMWSWNPKIHRTIKLPPAMLSQGWMGSDFTNDDLLNQRSIVVDYTHTIVGEEKIDNHPCYKIELQPKPDAPVVWGKITMWISKEHTLILKAVYYDEELIPVKTELAHSLKKMSGRILPTVIELIPADEPENKTIVTLNSIKFNIPINNRFFSIQNLTRVR